MLKTLLLTAALALSPLVASAQAQADIPDFYNRATLYQSCASQAPKDADKRIVNPVCNCATELAAATTREDGDRFGEFQLSSRDPIVAQLVPTCLQMLEANPPKFIEIFSSLEAEASGH